MKDHWVKDFPPLDTDEDYYVECAIDDTHLLIRYGMGSNTWREYLLLLEGRLDYFLGRVDE